MEKTTNPLPNYNGFKLISFELKDHKLFGDIIYDFIDINDKQDKIYTTVLIGQNGTLKSRLFQKIILIFWALNDLRKENKVVFSDKFNLTYALNNSIYEFTNIFEEVEKSSDNRPILKIDGKPITNFKTIDLPLSIVATAIMITDRFPFPNLKTFDIYQYLGSRYRPQLASTKTFIGRVVEFVSNNIDSQSFINGIQKITKEFLHNSNRPCITFYTSNTLKFFKGKLTHKDFTAFYEEMNLKYKDSSSPPFKLNHYNKIKSDNNLLVEIIDYCNELNTSGRLRDFSKSSTKAISFNLADENHVKLVRDEFRLLEHLRKLGILSPPDIEFLKEVEIDGKTKLEGYSIINSSSGEYNLLGSMIGIIASIKPNSLIFIDEPEISLHPNWQMKYLSFLRELLSDKEYATCHIIVATHSHFLISDLIGINSSVIVLERDSETNKLKSEPLKTQDTYCWSPDDILYNVFNVVSSRNKFVAEEIASILNVLSKNESDSKNKIEKETYETLTYLDKNLKANDPLKTVVNSILKKVLI